MSNITPVEIAGRATAQQSTFTKPQDKTVDIEQGYLLNNTTESTSSSVTTNIHNVKTCVSQKINHIRVFPRPKEVTSDPLYHGLMEYNMLKYRLRHILVGKARTDLSK